MKKIILVFLIMLCFVGQAFAQRCDSLINGFSRCGFSVIEYNGMPEPSTSLANEARVYFNQTDGKLKCSEDAGAYEDCVSGGTESNNLETVCTDIAVNEVPIGTGADTAVYKLLPDCNVAGSALAYEDSTQTWSCRAGLGGGSIDTTTVDDTTWSDGANVQNTWTFDLSGTDHTMTMGANTVGFTGNLQAPTITASYVSGTGTVDMGSASSVEYLDDSVMDTDIDFGLGANQVSASDIPIALGGGSPTIDQIQEYLDNTGSSGFFLGGALSDGGSGTLNVASGSGFIRTTNDNNAELQSFKWSASSGIAVTDDTTQYVYVDDSGVISLSTNEFLETPDKIKIGVVTDEAATIESTFSLGVRLQESVGSAGRFIRNVHGVERNKRFGGLIFGQSGDVNRDITMTAGQLEWGRTSYSISAFDTSGADTFRIYSANGLEDATASQWPNEQYDDAGTLTTMGNNKWANIFVWVEPDDHVLMVYGRAQFNSETLANEENIPSTSLPSRITETGLLTARFTFQKSANTMTIGSAFEQLFANASTSDHPTLANLAWTSAGHTGTALTIAGFDGVGASSEYTTTGSGTELVLSTSPTLVTPVLGVATGTTITSAFVSNGGTVDLTGSEITITTDLTFPSFTGDLVSSGTMVITGSALTQLGASLESDMILSNMQGSVTDGQVPNNITIDLATTVTTNANLTGEVTSSGNATTITDNINITSWNLTSSSIITATTYTAQAEIQFGDSDTSNYVGFKAPSVLAGNQIWVLPGGDGSDGQALKTDGSGNLTFGTVGGATVAYDDITAPDADSSVGFAGFTNTWTTSETASDFFRIVNTGDFADVSLLKLESTTNANPTDGTMLEIVNTDSDVDSMIAPEFTLTQTGVLSLHGTSNPGIAFGGESADPCGAEPAGFHFYSDGDFMCFCDSSGVDLQVGIGSTTPCTY